MEVAVWDTYVKKKNGTVMHFDIIVPKNTYEKIVYGYGCQYLHTKGEDGQQITAEACSFCHIEQAGKEIESSINRMGYFILEMEGCS